MKIVAHVTLDIENIGNITINQLTQDRYDIITPNPVLTQSFDIAKDLITGGYSPSSYWYCFQQAFGEDVKIIVKRYIKLMMGI